MPLTTHCMRALWLLTGDFLVVRGLVKARSIVEVNGVFVRHLAKGVPPHSCTGAFILKFWPKVNSTPCFQPQLKIVS